MEKITEDNWLSLVIMWLKYLLEKIDSKDDIKEIEKLIKYLQKTN